MMITDIYNLLISTANFHYNKVRRNVYKSYLSSKSSIYQVQIYFIFEKINIFYRVNGLVRNSAAFAEVYQCSTGSPMNPTKCTIW